MKTGTEVLSQHGKAVFLTDGPSRTVKIVRQEIRLRRTTPARLAYLKRTLPAKERQRLLKDFSLAPAWMHPIFRELAGKKS